MTKELEMVKKRVRKLKNIDVFELSFATSPANDKPYLFTKQNGEEITKAKNTLSINIESDGTAEGTSIMVGNKEVKDLDTFNFYFQRPREGNGEASYMSPISCSYSKGKVERGRFVGIENYYYKAEVNKMFDKIKDPMKTYFGKEISSEELGEFRKSEGFENEVVKSIDVINQYSASLPDDLKEAVGVIMKSVPEVQVKEEKQSPEIKKDEPVEKSTEGKTEKPEVADEPKEDFKKSIDEVNQSILKVQEEIKKSNEFMKTLDERVKKVEMVKGNKQLLEGQEENQNANAEITKSEKPWPSFFEEQ
jgi:hypothetical protein